jgi:hypothetical protein
VKSKKKSEIHRKGGKGRKWKEIGHRHKLAVMEDE